MGVGNGNDIDLVRLAADFDRVALIDLDNAALERAIARLEDGKTGRVERYCPIDLSGILPVLESWLSHRNPTDAELSAIMQSAKLRRGRMSGRLTSSGQLACLRS